MTRSDVASRFLRTLYGDNAPGHLVLFTLPESTVEVFRATQFDRAGVRAEGLSGFSDVYFGVGLQREPPESGRGRADGVTALPGFWMDVDCRAPYRDRDDLPPSKEEAARFLQTLPVLPTALVDSGHGIHGWWVFRELWVFGHEDDHHKAARLSEGWQRLVQAAAESKGWSLDRTADLARILRLPGTTNHKGQPTPVRMMDTSGPRCSPSDFESWVIHVPTRPEPSSVPPPLPESSSGRAAYVRAALLDECRRLAEAPEGERNNQLNRSAFALARFCAEGAARPEPVVKALVHAAHEAGLPDPRHPQEIERTIASAFKAHGVAI